MPPALENRTVVIVGGTAGLGLSAAKACVTAGASVVVVGRNADGATQACGELGPSARACVGDASLPGTATTAIETAIDAFGRFDSLYHVAGGSGRKWGDGPLHELTDEAVEATLRLNLASLIYSNRAAVRTLLKRKSPGSILNMGSVLGSSPSPRFFATHVYAAAKSAIVGFTKSCAAYYAKYDIRFNVVAPALVDTPMARRAAEDPQINKYIHAKQPLDGGRVGRPDDLDGAVVYLLSDEARYVTGQTLAVDGGWSVTEGRASPN